MSFFALLRQLMQTAGASVPADWATPLRTFCDAMIDQLSAQLCEC